MRTGKEQYKAVRDAVFIYGAPKRARDDAVMVESRKRLFAAMEADNFRFRPGEVDSGKKYKCAAEVVWGLTI